MDENSPDIRLGRAGRTRSVGPRWSKSTARRLSHDSRPSSGVLRSVPGDGSMSHAVGKPGILLHRNVSRSERDGRRSTIPPFDSMSGGRQPTARKVAVNNCRREFARPSNPGGKAMADMIEELGMRRVPDTCCSEGTLPRIPASGIRPPGDLRHRHADTARVSRAIVIPSLRDPWRIRHRNGTETGKTEYHGRDSGLEANQKSDGFTPTARTESFPLRKEGREQFDCGSLLEWYYVNPFRTKEMEA